MKQRILIVGSGFAGMWAAVSAARLAHLHQRDDINIQVLAPQPELRVRPRFYENNVASLVSPLAPLFASTGVDFIAGNAESIDDKEKKVLYRDGQGQLTSLSYDRLALATGSNAKRFTVVGADQFAFDIDQLESAKVFEKHLQNLPLQPDTPQRNTLVVCGGGFTGIELATELPSRLKALLGEDTQTKVIVVERGSMIGGRYSQALREVIAQASQELGIEWRLNAEVSSIDETGVTLSDGSHVASSTVVWTVGVQANPLTEQLDAKRDNLGRLYVDENLQVVGLSGVYATGDVANAATDTLGNTALMTCQHAIQLGKFAGNNVVASLIGIAQLPYRQENYVTCLDLGSWGAVFTEGWDQQVKFVREEAKKIKVSITNELIYPPKAERDSAFAAADPLAPFV
ncbi:MAG: NAD(P)/FAD-dependent oxidoreductase [Ewingella americana]|uniref:NAD(P)/FAD-dependent oxidoreductase n=1 Tax=Ewingella americana TaxID=41202 RepID=UPI002430AB74|nr:NAD(P)/FAD-dependent oxidoreductase [Ewingella americana]MCI1678419.1 NAD(P)/FAD-dependent oxidoreductase [Ewingella americana]MCI1854006.1 NAD(P)/FAD-dependent oxidoreductase [Ewingella americana]MCI1861306.1 NAD(P)/FAD-dependent oxidoreductase [Ewingella americana]MCI2144438.1 NAD(P)/FAD-dependent oxidoreductase [Ewingella americana]MCI2163711.1 NAD(P)/FAD-dependent oxidoreductase [Ewingella americana]